MQPEAVAPTVGQSLQQFLAALGQYLVDQRGLMLPAFLVLVWVVWWLWGVRWDKAWPVLAQGAWLPFVLLGIVIALAWSQLAPSDRAFLSLVVIPNFWWQLGGIGLLFCLALFCGWLQGVMHWAPAEMDLEPAAHEGHDHHGPGEDHAHAPVASHTADHAHGHH